MTTMTWLEFKQYVERRGVNDATEIDFINVAFSEISAAIEVEIVPPQGDLSPDRYAEGKARIEN